MALIHESDEVRIYHLVENDFSPTSESVRALSSRDVFMLLAGPAQRGKKMMLVLAIVFGVAAFAGFFVGPLVAFVVLCAIGCALVIGLYWHLSRKTIVANQVAKFP